MRNEVDKITSFLGRSADGTASVCVQIAVSLSSQRAAARGDGAISQFVIRCSATRDDQFADK